MVTNELAGKVVDLRAPRGHRDPKTRARDRFAGLRRSSGLTPTAFAAALSRRIDYEVTAEAVVAWETTAVPAGDVLLAAEEVAGVDAADLPPGGSAVRIVDTYPDLQVALAEVVHGAQEVLAVTGSRSRDPKYLALIEEAVTSRDLTYYRVLYGPLRHGASKNHLLRLFDLHRPTGKVNIGMFADLHVDSERFICASEQRAVIVLPSVNSLLNFDTGVVLDDPATAAAYVDHVRQAFAASQQLTDRSMIEALEVLR